MYPLSVVLKSSCKQLFRLNSFKSPDTSERRKHSQEYGNRKAQEKTKQYSELSITFEHSDITIVGCVDEIRVTGRNLLFIEHKNTESEAPYWLETQGVIQIACLEAIYAYRKNKLLKSASFIPAKQILYEEKPVKSFLWINKDRFLLSIDPNNYKNIIRFLLTKIRASAKWESATKFDEAFKHKEWDYFKQFITYKAVKKIC